MSWVSLPSRYRYARESPAWHRNILPERTRAHTAVVPIPARDSSCIAFWNTKRLALSSVFFRKVSSSPGRHLEVYCS